MRLLLIVLVFAACDNRGSTPDWSRMITQPKLLPYGAAAQFADGRAMRPRPSGVVAVDRITDPARREGRIGEQPVAAIPLPITRALLERGRERFDVVCAACHGVAGDGETPVAHAMQRRRPPSLHEPRIAALSPGAMYRVIVDGYGLMPSYTALLSVDDRWAVIAYVRTLELAWHAQVAGLPAGVHDELIRSVP
jgi:mono/diheme cytochrome c family protein